MLNFLYLLTVLSQNLDKLKLIDLSKSECLTQTPDFTGFPNIKRLIFQGCTSLHELHPFVGGLKKLIPLNLSGCSKLKKFPEIETDMTNLLELHLDGTAIEELPIEVGRVWLELPSPIILLNQIQAVLGNQIQLGL